MSTFAERNAAMTRLIPPIFALLADPDGPRWDDANVLAMQYYDVTDNFEEAFGTFMSVSASILRVACERGGLDPVEFMQSMTAQIVASLDDV